MAVPFLKMFLEYEPDEPQRAALEQASIVHAEIDREARSVLLRLELPRYVPEAVLNTAAAELSKLYGMRRVRFEPHYPPEALAEFDGQELTPILPRRPFWPVANGRLRGSGPSFTCAPTAATSSHRIFRLQSGS